LLVHSRLTLKIYGLVSESKSVKSFHCLKVGMTQLAKLIQNTDVKLGLGKEHQSLSMADIPEYTPSSHTIKMLKFSLNIVS
jgi:hypothetical protein